MASKAFGRKAPVHSHLVHPGAGGTPGEIQDLRKDIDEAFTAVEASLETPGAGGTGIIAVEEWVNPAASNDAFFMVAKNFTASDQAITAVTGTVCTPPRNVIASVAILAGAGAGNMTVKGTDVNGAAISEVLAVPAGTNVVVGNKAFKTVTEVDLPAIVAGAFAGNVKIGTGDKIGLSSKIKLRNAAPNVIAETVDGVVSVRAASATTATNQVTRTTEIVLLSAPVAAGAANPYHAQVAAGAPLNVNAAWTLYNPARNVQIILGAGGANPVVYTVTGTDYAGEALTEQITALGPGTYNGNSIFHTITSVTSDIDPAGATDILVGERMGLPSGFTVAGDILELAVVAAGVATPEAVVATHPTTGGFEPTNKANAARVYRVRYVREHNHTQAAHTHAAGLGVYATPAVGAPNGTFAPVTVPNGAHDYCVVYERDNA